MPVSATMYKMIVIEQTGTKERMILTLNEKKTLANAFYLFVFTNTTTKNVIKWIVNERYDKSANTDRYNEFVINASSVFDGEQPGQWNYEVYEQESPTNQDTTGLSEVERGKLTLKYTAVYQYTGYSPTSQFVGYDGK